MPDTARKVAALAAPKRRTRSAGTEEGGSVARWRRQGEAVGGGAGLAAAGESLQARVEVGRERVDECGLGGEDALLVSLAVQGNRLESTRVVEVAEFPDIEGDQFGQAASGEQCGEDDCEVALSPGVCVVVLVCGQRGDQFLTAS
nr:hypothetical protein [Rhodococcus sp. (in: high G+C Gram-positive bacteria)]